VVSCYFCPFVASLLNPFRLCKNTEFPPVPVVLMVKFSCAQESLTTKTTGTPHERQQRLICLFLLQVFMNYYWFGKSLKDAVAEPRLHSQLFPDMVLVEENFNEKLIKEIKKYGHRYVTNDTALFTGIF